MTALMQWSDAYSVGVATFDEDHREMLRLARELAACLEQQAEATARERLDDLLEYTVYHFEREEQALRDCDYPACTSHITSHHNLLRCFLKFKADLRYKRLTAEEAAEFVSDWVLRHIREEDKQYTACLNGKGLR